MFDFPMFDFLGLKPRPKAPVQPVVVSLSAFKKHNQRPADFAIQETNDKGQHVSWKLRPAPTK
jgi:hypothetical protein